MHVDSVRFTTRRRLSIRRYGPRWKPAAALYCAVSLGLLAPQIALAGPEFQCPGTRYIYSSSVNVPDPANTAGGCVTAYDGGTVANDGAFNTSTPFSLGSSIWTAITNALGQLVQIINNAATTWNLGPLPGRTGSIGSPALQTTYTYDVMGRVESTVAPVSPTTVTTSYTYNSTYTNQVATTDRNGNVTTYSYNMLADPGRPATVTETAGGGTQLTYTYQATATGRPDTVIESPGSRTLTYTYNDIGPDRTVTRSDSTGTTTTYTYDTMDRVTKVTDALGHITTYSYDPVGGNLTEVAETTPLPPNPDRVFQYQYDVQGRVTEVRDSFLDPGDPGDDRYTCYQYDSAGHLTKYTEDTQPTCNGRSGLTTTFAYDARGLLSSITDPQGAQASLKYVPAPGSFLLLGLALGALAVRRRQ